MANLAKSLVRRRGAPGAAITSVAVSVALIVFLFAGSAINAIPVLEPATLGPTDPTGAFLLVHIVPFAAGFFLTLWLVAPIAAELHPGHVIMRSLLATANGAAFALIVAFVVGVIVFFGSAQEIVIVGRDAITSPALRLFLEQLSVSLTLVLDAAALAMVGVLLQWNWLQRHPAKHPVSGMLDEV